MPVTSRLTARYALPEPGQDWPIWQPGEEDYHAPGLR
jgi:hypothetical protein